MCDYEIRISMLYIGFKYWKGNYQILECHL